MAFKDEGIEEIQKYIRGGFSNIPTHVIFSTDSDFDPEEDVITSFDVVKELYWFKSGKSSIYSSEMSSLEGVGEVFKTTAIIDNEDPNIGTQWTIDGSSIGEKTNLNNIQLEGEVIIRRPLE